MMHWGNTLQSNWGGDVGQLKKRLNDPFYLDVGASELNPEESQADEEVSGDVRSSDGDWLAELSTPDHLGPYRLLELLATGGMGAVYRAEHTGLSREVALKVMLPQLRGAGEARFRREVRTAAKIAHPNVVDVRDVGEEEGVLFMVMELLEGLSLSDYSKMRGRLEVSEAVSLILPAVSALGAAHRAGVIHRDLKPSNIFLSDQGGCVVRPMLLDFGIAKLLNASGPTLSAAQQVLGTPGYLAPEQIENPSAVDHRSDQYALGAVLYTLLVGSPPFAKHSHFHELALAILSSAFQKPIERVTSLPEELSNVITRAMNRRMSQRFEDIHAFGRALLPFASKAIQEDYESEFSEDQDGRPSLSARGLVVLSQPLPDGRVAADATTAMGDGPTGRSSDSPPSLTPSSRPVVTSSETPTAVGVMRGGSSGRRSIFELASMVFVVLAGVAMAFAAFQSEDGEDITISASPPMPESVATADVESESRPGAPEFLDLRVLPNDAEVTLDGLLLGRGHVTSEVALDGSPHRLVVSAPGFEPRTLVFIARLPEGTVTLRALPDEASEVEREPQRTSHTERARRRRAEAGQATSTPRPPARSESAPRPTPAPASLQRGAYGAPIVY